MTGSTATRRAADVARATKHLSHIPEKILTCMKTGEWTRADLKAAREFNLWFPRGELPGCHHLWVYNIFKRDNTDFYNSLTEDEKPRAYVRWCLRCRKLSWGAKARKLPRWYRDSNGTLHVTILGVEILHYPSRKKWIDRWVMEKSRWYP